MYNVQKTFKKKMEGNSTWLYSWCVDLPRDKRIEIGLTYIYGIGRISADKILAQAGVNPDIRVRDLTDDDVKKISAVIDETMTVEGDLRRKSPSISETAKSMLQRYPSS